MSGFRAAAVYLAAAALLSAAGGETRIAKTSRGYELRRAGKPYFIKGVKAISFKEADFYLPEALRAGANSLRSSPEFLGEAQRLGFSVLVDIGIGKWRKGFNYDDPAAVREQLNRIRETVLKYKDHPAVLMWAIGNEPGIAVTRDQAISCYRAINGIAEMIHAVDGRHPAITVIGMGELKRTLADLNQHAPALDALGVNAYSDIFEVPEALEARGWTRPFLVTEFGPRGHWQVAKTAWKIPIEDTSTEKAEHYLKSQREVVEGNPRSLGSYAFLWYGPRHEKTHTWYNMFLHERSRLGAIDAMQYTWTGKWPPNRAPRITGGGLRVGQLPDGLQPGPQVVKAGGTIYCRVLADDPDGNTLSYEFDLRLDVADDPNVGGDWEPSTPPIAGTVLESKGANAVVRLPEKAGNYRLFVYVRDGRGSAATANIPLRAE